MPGCNWTTVWLTAGACGVLLSAAAAADGDAVDDTAADGAIDDETALADDPSADKVPATGVDVHPVSPKSRQQRDSEQRRACVDAGHPLALDP